MVEFNQRADDRSYLSLTTNNHNHACLVLHAPLVVEQISDEVSKVQFLKEEVENPGDT